jgi:hypothetical protein
MGSEIWGVWGRHRRTIVIEKVAAVLATSMVIWRRWERPWAGKGHRNRGNGLGHRLARLSVPYVAVVVPSVWCPGRSFMPPVGSARRARHAPRAHGKLARSRPIRYFFFIFFFFLLLFWKIWKFELKFKSEHFSNLNKFEIWTFFKFEQNLKSE